MIHKLSQPVNCGFLALVPLLLAAHCEPAPSPSPGAAGAPSTGGAPSSSPCDDACAHFRELDCPAGEPTEEGATCTEVCENLNASGTLMLDTDCVLRARDCDSADKCVR